MVVDNVIATPILQQPLALGADVVVYSATKHIDGQGRCLGGVVLSSRKFKTELLVPYLKNTGPALSPFNAWVLLKGLETLPLRLRAHVANAEAVARWLVDQPAGHRRPLPRPAGPSPAGAGRPADGERRPPCRLSSSAAAGRARSRC